MDQNNTLCERLQTDGGCDRKTAESRNCEYQSCQDYIERQISVIRHPVGFGMTPRDETRKLRFYRCTRYDPVVQEESTNP